MPRKNVVKAFSDESYYHVYNRGVHTENIFQDKQDYSVLLSYLKTYLSPVDTDALDEVLLSPTAGYDEKQKILAELSLNNFYGHVELLAYCLMPNHFHLLLFHHHSEAIPSFMKSFFTRYVGYFNKRHQRTGPLFESTYKAVHVRTDEQLLYVSRYIHRNPLPKTLKTGQAIAPLLVRQPSSYPAYCGDWHQDWVSRDTLLDAFSGNEKKYCSFVSDTTSVHDEKTAVYLPYIYEDHP